MRASKFGLDRQQGWPFPLLGAATLFEGYDTKLAILVAPYLDCEFSVGRSGIAYAQSLLNLGAIAAFLPIWLADRVGRPPAPAIYLIQGFGAALVCYRAESGWAIRAGYVALDAATGSLSLAVVALCGLSLLCVPLVLRLPETRGIEPLEVTAPG